MWRSSITLLLRQVVESGYLTVLSIMMLFTMVTCYLDIDVKIIRLANVLVLLMIILNEVCWLSSGCDECIR